MSDMSGKEKLKLIKPAYIKMGIYELAFNERNIRKITKKGFEKLKNKILRGMYEPLKVWKNGNVVLSGNQRLAVIRQLVEEDGYEIKKVDVALYDVDEKTAKFIQLTENEHEGDTDLDRLVEEMEYFDDIDLGDILDPKIMRQLDKKIKGDMPPPPDLGDGDDNGSPGDGMTQELNRTDIIITGVPKVEAMLYHELISRIGELTGIASEWGRFLHLLKLADDMNDEVLKQRHEG